MARIQPRKIKPSQTSTTQKTDAKHAEREVKQGLDPKPTPKAKSRKATTTSVEQTKLPERISSEKTGKLSMKSLNKKHATPVDTTEPKSFLSGFKKKE